MAFSEDTKIITEDGVVSFKELKDGDEIKVLTHRGRWIKGTVYETEEKLPMYRVRISSVNIKGSGSELLMTRSHRLPNMKGMFMATSALFSEKSKLMTINPILQKERKYNSLTRAEKMLWCKGFVLGYFSKNPEFTDTYRLKLKNDALMVLMWKRFKSLGFSVVEDPDNLYISVPKKFLPNPKKFLDDLMIDEYTSEVKVMLFRGILAFLGESKSSVNEDYTKISSNDDRIKYIIERYAPLFGYFISNESRENQRAMIDYKFSLNMPIEKRTKSGKKYFDVRELKVIEMVYETEDYGYTILNKDGSFMLSNGIVVGS